MSKTEHFFNSIEHFVTKHFKQNISKYKTYIEKQNISNTKNIKHKIYLIQTITKPYKKQRISNQRTIQEFLLFFSFQGELITRWDLKPLKSIPMVQGGLSPHSPPINTPLYQTQFFLIIQILYCLNTKRIKHIFKCKKK